MTDINKLKLLINAEIIENRSYYALFNEGMKKGAEIAQSIILHQNRWRKVEEELPEVLTDVLIKDSFGKIDIGCLYDNGIWSMTPPIDRKITEWKPI